MIELGDLVKDKISGYEGVAVCRAIWLFDCVRITVHSQKLGSDGEPGSAVFDEPQLDKIGALRLVVDLEAVGGPRDDQVGRADAMRER